MVSYQITVFRAKTPRSYLVSATIGALTLTTWVLARLLLLSWRGSRVVPGAWPKVTLMLAGLFGFVTLSLWSSRAFRDRRRTVSVMESGLQTPEGYCAWDAITEARFVNNPDDPCILVKGRYLARDLVIPLQITEDGSFRRLVEQYGGEGHRLVDALVSAGA